MPSRPIFRFLIRLISLFLFGAVLGSMIAAEFPWHFVSPTPTGNAIREVAFLNGQFLAVGDAGTLLTSSDGTRWTSQNLPTSYDMVSIAYANGRYVVSDSRSGLYTSLDAVHWDTAKVALYYYWAGARTALLAFGNGKYLRLMSYSSASTVTVSTSSDGITWQNSTPNFPAYFPSALTFAADRFVAISDGGIWTSTDGVSWTKAAIGETPASGSLAYGNGILLATRTNAPCLRSTDALNWAAANNAPTVSQIRFVNGFFYAREDSTGACLRSDDALTWSTFSTASMNMLTAAYGNGVYVARNNAANSELVRSSDGITWVSLHRRLAPFPTTGARIVSGNGVFLADDLRSTDGEHWAADTFVHIGSSDNPTRVYFCRDRFIVYQDHAFYVSIDGRIGQKVFIPTDPAETFGVPLFAAGKFWIPSTQGSLVSADGAVWTRGAALDDAGGRLAFGNGLFVRTSPSKIESSPDGITWSVRYTVTVSDPNQTLYRLGAPLFGNGRFVIGGTWTNTHGYTGNILFTSTDGTTWADMVPYFPNGAVALSFENNVFVSQSLPELAGRSAPHGSTNLPSPQFNVSRDGIVWQSFPIPTNTEVSSFAGNDSVFLASTAAGLLATSFPPPAVPSIDQLTQIGSPTMTRGDSVILKVAASGPAPLSYQWRLNGIAIPNANQPSYFTSTPGTYDVVVTNTSGSTTSRTVVVTMNDSWLANVSSRAYAGTGEDQLIQGFVARPAVIGYKTVGVLARAIGPTLTQFNLHEVMANPILELHRHSDQSILARNDRWYSSELVQAFKQVGAFALPTDSEDAALTCDPTSGAYSITVTGANGGQGIVLSELYDLSLYGRLINLSARARVGEGDRTLIAGFVIAGGKPLKVLIRGVGPTLSTQGIAAPLANPKLTLFDSGGHEIHNNDNWNQARNLAELRAATTATGAFTLPENSHDAAMLETLDPGVYTVHVTSMDGSSGVALVEIYEAP